MTGFLGTGAPLSFDVLVVSLIFMTPVLGASVFFARRGRVQVHRRLQWGLTAWLLVGVTLFELEVRTAGGWREAVTRADPAAVRTAADWSNAARLLAIHLVFAVTTPLLWAAALISSKRGGRTHRLLGRFSAADFLATTVTGLTWYASMFVVQ